MKVHTVGLVNLLSDQPSHEAKAFFFLGREEGKRPRTIHIFISKHPFLNFWFNYTMSIKEGIGEQLPRNCAVIFKQFKKLKKIEEF